MTTTTLTTPTRTNPTTMTDTVTAIPFSRLVAVEKRKFSNTLTSKILLSFTAMLIIGVIVARAVVSESSYSVLFGTATLIIATLLPVVGILAVTSEWSHRTALTTFTLEPRRARVLIAKCIPPVIAVLAASLLAALAAMPATALSAELHGAGEFDVTVTGLLGRIGTNVVLVLFGLALGMLFMNAPAAIVLLLVNSMLWTFIKPLAPAVEEIEPWLNINHAAATLSDGDWSGAKAAQFAVCLVVSIAVPMAIGVVRVLRKEMH